METQATLLRRAMLTADLLRWMLIDHGIMGFDHMPDIPNPRTGELPPGDELVVEEPEPEPKPKPKPKPKAKPKEGGPGGLNPFRQTTDRPPEEAKAKAIKRGKWKARKAEEMEMEMVSVPAFSEMDEETVRKHLSLRHPGARNEAGHSADHFHGPRTTSINRMRLAGKPQSRMISAVERSSQWRKRQCT